MNYKIILFILLISTSVFSVTFNTTYKCKNATMLFENTSFSDDTFSYKYTPCENGCSNGYCVSTTETNK